MRANLGVHNIAGMNTGYSCHIAFSRSQEMLYNEVCMCIFLTKEEMHCVNGEVWEILQGALKYGENNRFAHVGLELSGHRQANLLVSGEGSAGVARTVELLPC